MSVAAEVRSAPYRKLALGVLLALGGASLAAAYRQDQQLRVLQARVAAAQAELAAAEAPRPQDPFAQYRLRHEVKLAELLAASIVLDDVPDLALSAPQRAELCRLLEASAALCGRTNRLDQEQGKACAAVAESLFDANQQAYLRQHAVDVTSHRLRLLRLAAGRPLCQQPLP